MNVLCCCFVEQADAARRNGKAVSELKLRVQRKEMLLRMNNIVDEDDAPIPVRQKNNEGDSVNTVIGWIGQRWGEVGQYRV